MTRQAGGRKHPFWAVTGPRAAPPTARTVAERALVLVAVAARAAVEDEPPDDNFRAFVEDIPAWLRDIGLEEKIEEHERAVLLAPIGSLATQRAIDASWQGEGAAVLAWALGQFELPPYDQRVEPARVGDCLGFLDDNRSNDVLCAAHLRPRKELERLANLMFTVHWRLRDQGRGGKHLDFARMCKEVWFGPLETDGLVFINDDLALSGQEVASLSVDAIEKARSIAVERQRAANWLMGQDATYSCVSCDT